MDIIQAKIEIAQKMLNISKYKQAFMQLPEDQIPPGEFAKMQEQEHDLKTHMAFYASMPELSPIMISWMVDIVGKDSCNVENLAAKFPIPEDVPADKTQVSISGYSPNDEKIHGAITEQLKTEGGVLQMVITTLERNNFVISDSGGGCCGWHVGVACNDAEAARLCAIVHQRFKKAISVGAIAVFKKFWEHRFPDLYNDDDALQFLREHKDYGKGED